MVDRLWSPWRLEYITRAGQDKGCIFCPTSQLPENAPLVVFEGRHCFVILNLYPYNNGHLMVVPNRHLCALEALRPEEQAEMMTLARVSEMALNEAYRPHGINVGINLGKAAGAGIENHLHMHFVPRWSGHTEFSTGVGEARVLPEDLAATVTRVRPIFERLANE